MLTGEDLESRVRIHMNSACVNHQPFLKWFELLMIWNVIIAALYYLSTIQSPCFHSIKLFPILQDVFEVEKPNDNDDSTCYQWIRSKKFCQNARKFGQVCKDSCMFVFCKMFVDM